MSYLYAVNRDNPLGYFPVDNDYKYYQLKTDYATYQYGGGSANPSNPTPTPPLLYDAFSSYSTMNTLKVIDQTSKNNIPSLTGLSYYSPIVMGNTTSVKVNPASSIEIKNVYDVFTPSSNPHTWSAEFWMCLDWQDGQGLDFTPYDSFSTNNFRNDIGFRNSISTYPRILLLSIGYYATNSGTQYFNNYASVMYNQQTNSIEFYVPQADGTYAKSYAVISDLDAPIHVYATYSNQTINISINGKSGISAYVGNGLYQDSAILNNYYKLIFRFAGQYTYVDPATSNLTTLQLQNNQYLLLSNLTFYDYVLSERQLANHIKWAFYDNKPIKSSVQYGTHYLPLETSSSNYIYSKNYSGKEFSDYSDLYNLNITSTGLQPSKVDRIYFNNIDGSSTMSVPSDKSGVLWTGGKAGLDFSGFGTIASSPCTISLLVEPSALHPDEYILSISNVNGSSTLFIDRVSGIYNLKYYDVLNGGTITTLASIMPNYLKAYHKIAISLTNNLASLNVISCASETSIGTGESVISSTYAQTFSFSQNSILTIGQSYHSGNDVSVLLSNSSTFSYLNISDIYVSDFTNQYINGYYYSNGYPWNGIIKFACPLQYYSDPYNPVSVTKSFPMYQMGYWKTTVPLSSLDSIVGSKVEWGSTNNCLVEYSFNNQNVSHPEQTWYSLSRSGAPISGYNFSNKLTNMQIRVTMITKYDVQDINQSFNNLNVNFYKNLNFYTEGESFLLTPASRSSNKTTFTVKNHSKPIQTRPTNLGLLFSYSSDDSSVPGYAKITNTYNKTLGGIDFWYRADSNYNSTTVLGGDPSLSEYPSISIDSNGNLSWNYYIKSLYVNGQKVTNISQATTGLGYTGTYHINAYDPIHISASIGRTNLLGNPSFEVDTTNWSNPQFFGTITRDSTYSYSGSYSGKFGIGTGNPFNLLNCTVSLDSGVYTVSGYYYIPAGSKLAGRTISIYAFSGPNGTSSAVTSPALVAGSWVRARTSFTVSSPITTTVSLNTQISPARTFTVSLATANGSNVLYSATNHGLTTGDSVTITGFSPSTFNQTLGASVTVVNSNQFTIPWQGIPGAGSATGTGTATLDYTGSSIYTDAWLLEPGNSLNTYIDSSASYTGDLYINGSNILGGTGSESSYGYINIWENALTEQDSINRYNLFINNTNLIISNDNLMNSSSNPLDFDMSKDMAIQHKIGS